MSLHAALTYVVWLSGNELSGDASVLPGKQLSLVIYEKVLETALSMKCTFGVWKGHYYKIVFISML